MLLVTQTIVRGIFLKTKCQHTTVHSCRLKEINLNHNKRLLSLLFNNGFAREILGSHRRENDGVILGCDTL
jgi:hypothetical protein